MDTYLRLSARYAALKLGVGKDFALVPPAQAYWLAKRAQAITSVTPSTYGKGIDAT